MFLFSNLTFFITEIVYRASFLFQLYSVKSIKMPIDYRRNNGPESSVSYQLHKKIYLLDYEEKLKVLLKEGNIRRDGRNRKESRKIFIESGVVSKAKGSAYIECGETKVIVSVFDPREIPKQSKFSINGDLFCDFKYSPFASIHRRSQQTDTEEKSLAQALKRAMEPAICRHEFPNFQVDIFVNVLQDDGSALAAAIIASGLAVANAGIPMFDITTAANVAITGENIFMDPTREEEELCLSSCNPGEHGLVTLARMSTHEQISEIWQSGNIKTKTLLTIIDHLVEANRSIVPIIQQTLIERVSKFIENKNP
ncbi:exosome complex component MTR3-like [Lutzomyia longipalpis]|uniref:exosome complex component MTR3-like n=1 Tax=Lutzomyia longipalpis TaxID=7200 RepID=UPI0024839BF5|nr:exosome complex component MTR3-like [Lutzomyia longipalpis]